MSFSTDLDKALAPMATARKAAVKTALTNFQTAVAAEQTTHSSPTQEVTWVKEQCINMARELAAQIR